jgi:hypothetical protein
MHYWRWQQHGNPTANVRPTAKPGQSTKTVTISGKTTNYHRWLWTKTFGLIPEGLVIHHVNGDHFDNRIENLELMPWGTHSKLHRTKWKRCIVDGCPVTKMTGGAHGLCKRHYRQQKTHGRILAVHPLRRR